MNICVLAITDLFNRPISDLPHGAQTVTRIAFVTAAILTLLVAGVGMLALFYLLIQLLLLRLLAG